MSHISNEDAERVIAAAKHFAADIGATVSIAIQDHGTHLVAFSRMDGSFLGSIDVAIKKARTSALFRLESQEIWNFAKAEGPAHGIELSNDNLITFAGGIPLFDHEKNLVGSIGVSGGTVEQDYAVASAGRDAFVKGAR